MGFISRNRGALLAIVLALTWFIGTSVSLSSSSSFSSKSTSRDKNGVTDQMEDAAVAEVERLFRFFGRQSESESSNDSSSVVVEKPPTVWRSREEAATYIRENIDTVLFDCDGVLYRTTTLCPGASQCIKDLMEQGKRVLFVTNNAAVNRRELAEKLSRLLGTDSLKRDQMVSSAYSSAAYLQEQLLGIRSNGTKNPRVHVIGSSGLCEELVAAGFDVTGGPSNNLTSEPGSMSREELASYDFDHLHPIDALVVGHDIDMNFRKLCIASNLLLKNPDALFVATNKDSFDVVDADDEEGDLSIRHIVGNGATVVALEYASKRTAVNVGKPSKDLFELIRKTQSNNDGLKNPSRCLFVGDRLDTDIRFGIDNGMKSLLVMTGVTTAETIENLQNGTTEEPLPDFILPHVGMMV